MNRSVGWGGHIVKCCHVKKGSDAIALAWLGTKQSSDIMEQKLNEQVSGVGRPYCEMLPC